MRIGIIGAGWLGGTVGHVWVEAGHEVRFSSRHPERLDAMVRALGSCASTGTPAGGRGERLGVPLASDDAGALQIAEQLVRDAGCAPLVVGGLADARCFQRGGPGFRANTSLVQLRRLLAPHIKPGQDAPHD